MTTEAMNTEITDAVKRNLPAQVSEVLLGELKELSELRASEVQRKAEIVALQKRLSDSQINNLSVDALTTREKAAADKMAEAVKKELRIEITELQLKIANERRVEIKELVTALFRSPMRTETVNGMLPVPVTGNPGGMGVMGSPGYVINSPAITTTTTSTS